MNHESVSCSLVLLTNIADVGVVLKTKWLNVELYLDAFAISATHSKITSL